MARLGVGNLNLPAIAPSDAALRLAILDPLALRPGAGYRPLESRALGVAY